MPNHPFQPLEPDKHGTMRFKPNAIVRHLLDTPGPHDMNTIALENFSREDRVQFAQLIGYSLFGFGELDYVRNEEFVGAQKATEDGCSSDAARVAALEATLKIVRERLAPGLAVLFERHPDDFKMGGGA